MSTRELERLLAGADPVDRERLERLDLAAMEGELAADVERFGAAGDPGAATAARSADAWPVPAPRRRRPRALVLAGGAAALALVIALVVVLAGGGSEAPSRAYGAELIRFAESSPLLLLEEPGWRVDTVSEHRTREGTNGAMKFVTGRPVSLEDVRPTGAFKDGRPIVTRLPSAAARRRLVEVRWRPEAEGSVELHPGGRHRAELPVLGTTAVVDTRAELFGNEGGPDDHEMIATWTEGGNVVELQAAVRDLAEMEERLGRLTKVDSQTWLEAMPAKVVKAADFEGSVKKILRGIPLPRTFAISRVPDEGLTTSREAVTTKVTSTVACLWLRQWGAARRSGDEAAEAEATKALAGSQSWPIFRELGAESPYVAGELGEIDAAMARGYWIYRGHPQNLLKHAEGLGCARLGLPLLPEKIKRQREHGVPPPPE